MNTTVNKLIKALEPYFVRSSGNNVIGGNLSPDASGIRDLGTREKPFRRVYALELVGSAAILDDQISYVHIANARTITAQHTFAPLSTAAPFVLGANAQGQVVTGLMADQLNKTVTAGNGLTGGGALSGNITVTLGTPTSLSATSTNSSSTGTHTHAIDSTIARSAINITAGNGLTGGGNLTADRSIVLGTPSSLTATSTNTVTSTSHTHVIDSTIARSAITVSAGVGLSGGGDLTANRTVSMGTPSALTATSTNSVSGTTHTHSIDSTIARSAITITAGDGLTGGGDLTANRTVTLGTPGALSASTTNAVTTTSHTHSITANVAASGLSVFSSAAVGSSSALARADHIHAIASSPSPGAAESLLASDATGKLTLPLFVATTSVTTPSLVSPVATELSITSGADTLLNPGGVVKLGAGKLIKSSGAFTSGFAGSGWQIDDGVVTSGRMTATFDDLVVRGTMSIYELLIQQIRATNGSVFVSSAAKLASASLVSGVSYTCIVEGTGSDYQPFAVGDVLRAQRINIGATSVVWKSDLVVTAINTSGNQRAFTANLIGASTPPAKGMEFVRLGNTSDVARQGAVYITADDSGAPFIDVVNGITAHADWNTAGKVKVRLGRLDGVTGNTNEYGLWAGNGTGDTAGRIVASTSGVTLHNVPVDFKAGSSTVVMRLSPGSSAPFLALGATLPTGPLMQNGLWMGKDGADYEFRVGTVSGGILTKGLHWDGANLVWKATNTSLDASGNLTATNATLTGTITADLGAIGGWTIASTGLTATNIGLYSGAANTARLQVGTGSNIAGVNSVSEGTDIAFWAGDTHANRTAAEFRVRADGQLYATGATLSGAITATSGTITGDFSVTSGGKLSAGGGGVLFDTSGQAMGLYPNIDGAATPPDTAKAIAWYDTPSTRTGLQARQYVGKASDSTPHWNVTVNPGGSAPLTMTLWWGGATLNDLRFTNLAQVTGLPALFLSGGITPTAQVQSGSRLQLNSGSEFLASTHLKVGTTNTYDLGEAGVKWRKLYVGEVIADTVSGGTALGGNTWQRADAGDMYIYSFSEATNRTLYVANPGAGTMSLDVEGNITLGGSITVGGNVDGVDLSAFKSAYDSHNHDGRYYTETELQTSGSATVHWGNISSKPSTFAPSAHALVGSDHTASGLTIGHVIRASGTGSFAWAQLAHSDLSGVGTNSHATIDSHIAATAAHGATGAVVGTTNTQTLTNKTLTTPTIGDFTNAQHAHTGASSGGTIAHGSLTGVGANDHHNQSHVLASTSGLGADHTVTGLTARQVLRATSATNAAFGAIEDADLPSTIVRTSRQVVAGNGLTGGGALSSDVTVTLGTPSTLTVSSTNAVTSTSHTHAITSSSNPGTSPSLLSTTAGGLLTLANLATTGSWYKTGTVYEYYEVAEFHSGGNPTTGTLKITLPKRGSSTMMVLRIVGFQYTSTTTYGRGGWEALVSGYNFSTGWVDNGAQVILHGEAPFGQVRLCDDGANDIILLGDTTSRWYYPKISVAYALMGANNLTGWETGWSISVITDETGITTRRTPAIYRAPPDTRTLTAGNGLTGGGDLSADRTFTLGTPTALSATSTDAVTTTSHTHSITTGAAVGLSVSSTNTEGSGTAIARADHTHAIATSSNPGVAASILASDASGNLNLQGLFIRGTRAIPSVLQLRSTTNDSSWSTGDLLGAVEFYSQDASSPGQGVKAAIRAVHVGTATSLSQTGLVFTTNSDTEQMRIDHLGNVAIGSTSPGSFKLHVTGAASFTDATVTSLTASRLIASDGSDKLVSVGDLSSWIAGTTNRVTVSSDGDGTVTLSAPQDIHASATPTFGGLIAPWLRPASDSTTALQLRNAAGTAILTVDTTNSRVGVGVTPTSTLHVRGTPGSNTYLKIDTTEGASYDKFIELVSGGNISSGSHWIYATDGLADGSDFIVRGDGAVAIGSLDPGSYKLHVSGTGKFTGSVDTDVQFLGQVSDTVSAPSFSWTSDTNTGMWRPAADTLSITTGGTEVARFAVRDIAFFDSTLEPWSTTYRGLQLGAYASIMVAPTFNAGYSSHLIYNAYYDGAWKYQNSNPSVSYMQGSAGHTWRVAATGSADAALTWTAAMTLSLDGRLSIGNTNNTYALDVTGDARLTGDLYVDGGLVDFGSDYFEEDGTYLQLKGAKPFTLNQTIRAASWNITTAGAATLTDVIAPSVRAGAATELVIGAGADIQLNPTGVVKLASGKLVRSSTFTSGFAGSGWQIDDGVITAGRISAEFDDLTIRGRLRVYELLIQQIRATNGSVFVTSTGKAKTVSGGPSSFTITTDTADNHGFLVGDLIRAQRFTGSSVYQSDLQVTAVANLYTFTATKIAGDDPASGMDFVRLGSTSDASRRGSVYLTADDSGAPFIDIVDGINSHSAWNSRTADAGVKARIGRITGITGNANEYGIWAGTGTGNTAQSLVASSAGITLNNAPINFKAGSSTIVMQLSPGAGNTSPFLAMGSALPTAPLTGDGLWMGKDGGDYEFRVGTISGGALSQGMHWDGSKLNIRGSLVLGPGTGYTVKDAWLYLPLDAPPSAPWQLNTTGHLGQPGLVTGNVIGEPGRFGGAARLRGSGTNYISNPSFETDTSYWTIYNGATYERVTTDAAYGSACASITVGDTSDPYLYRANLENGPTLATGQTYTFSVYVKAGNAGAVGKNVTLRLRENASGSYQTSTVVAATSSWQRVSVTRTLTHATPTSLNHYVIFTSTAGSGDVFLLDAIQLEQTAYASPYIDSTMPGVVLSSTNHVQAAEGRLSYVARQTVPLTGSLSMWVKPINTGNTYVTFFRYSGAAGHVILRAQPSNSSWQGYWGATARTSAASAVQWNTWQHVVVTGDGTNTTVYVNGVQVAAGTSGTALSYHASAYAAIGYSLSAEAGCGWVDDVFTTPNVLSADDVRAIYESGQPVYCPTSNFEFQLSDGTLANITANSTGIYAINANGDESFALANGAKVWGSRYSGGNSLASGDLVLGDPDQFHFMYDASAASLLIGKATEEHIAIDATSLALKYNTTTFASMTASDFVIGTVENIRITPTIVEFRNSSTVIGSLDGTTLTLGQTSGNHVVITATSLDIKYGSTSKIGMDSSGNASFTGSITATSGTVGGWTIGATLSATNLVLTPGAANTAHILAGTGSTAGGINSAATSGDVVFWAGSNFAGKATANFTVTAGGSITAKAGTVGGWALGTDDLTGGNVYLHDTGYIRIGAESADRLWLSATDGTYRLWVGDDTAASAPVRIQKTGAFHFGSATRYLSFDGTNIAWAGVSTSLTTAGLFTAANANITGAIDANSGTIGALTVDGALTIGTGGRISSGATAWGTGDGFWFEHNSGNPRVRIGTAAGNRLLFETATGVLTIVGNGSGITSISGNNITTGTLSADRIGAGSITADKINVATLSALTADMGTLTAGSIVIGSTNKIWLNDSADGALALGGSVKGSAPFQVSNTGVLTATGATVTGTIQATAGYIGNADGWNIGAGEITSVSSGATAMRLSALGASPFLALGATAAPGLWMGDGLWMGQEEVTTNLVSNPSFETNTTSWSNYSTGTAAGSRTRVTTHALAGTYSYELVKTGGGTTDRWGISRTRSVTAGEVLTFSAWIKVIAITGGNQAVRINCQSNITNTSAYLYGTGDWRRVSITATATATGTASFYIWIDDCTTATIYVDAVQLENKAYATPYIDGSMATGTWGGTAHASASSRTAATRSRMGTVANNALTAGWSWDGAALNVVGSITATSGSIAGALTMGASGGIYQGTGTFASPTTGLKIWNDGGAGRIGGYSGGNLLWYSGSDGNLYTGGGAITFDNLGVSVSEWGSYTPPEKMGFRFYEGGGYWAGLYGTTGSDRAVEILCNVDTGAVNAWTAYHPSGNSYLKMGAATNNGVAESSIRAVYDVSLYSVITAYASSTERYITLASDLINLNAVARLEQNLTFMELSSTPTSPSSGTEARVYMKGDKLIIQYNDGGTVRYKYLDLTGTGVTWVHTTTAP